MAIDTCARYKRQIREADMRRTIMECVESLGGRVWSVRDSRGMGVDDMPDLLISVPPHGGKPGIVLLLELKSQYRQITPGQQHVLDQLATCTRITSGVVRPVPRPGELSMDEALAIVKGERAA